MDSVTVLRVFLLLILFATAASGLRCYVCQHSPNHRNEDCISNEPGDEYIVDTESFNYTQPPGTDRGNVSQQLDHGSEAKGAVKDIRQSEPNYYCTKYVEEHLGKLIEIRRSMALSYEFNLDGCDVGYKQDLKTYECYCSTHLCNSSDIMRGSFYIGLVMSLVVVVQFFNL